MWVKIQGNWKTNGQEMVKFNESLDAKEQRLQASDENEFEVDKIKVEFINGVNGNKIIFEKIYE